MIDPLFAGLGLIILGFAGLAIALGWKLLSISRRHARSVARPILACGGVVCAYAGYAVLALHGLMDLSPGMLVVLVAGGVAALPRLARSGASSPRLDATI